MAALEAGQQDWIEPQFRRITTCQNGRNSKWNEASERDLCPESHPGHAWINRVQRIPA